MPVQDFTIQQANLMPGLQALGMGLQSRGQRLKEEDAQRQNIVDREEGARLLQSGTPDEIMAFSVKKPGIMKDISAGIEQHTKMQNKEITDYAKRIVFGSETPSDVLIEMADQIIERGGDPSGAVASIRDALKDPEQAKQAAERVLSFYDSQAMKQYRELQGETSSDIKVGAQEILEDGTIIQSTDKGPVVYNPEGERVKGRGAADAVAQARAQKVSNIRKAAGEKKMASLEAEEELKGKVEAGVISQKEAAKISSKAFDRLEGINQNIDNIDEAIRLIDEGAQTGVVESKLPSIRQASIRLDNLQGRLGLDVLRNTTFGALSEAELKFALSTALPKDLQGPALKQWLQDKKNAQEKLADYVESAAIYLGTPGNTVAGLIEKNRSKEQAQQPEEQQVEYQEGQTATGPNGAKMIFRNGNWEAM